MSKTNWKTIVLVAFASLAVGATGCKCICLDNKAAGIPTITCQPLDQEIYLPTNGCPQTVLFRVGVKTENATRFAWFKLEPTERGLREVPQDCKRGGLSNVLRIDNVGTNDWGLYYCEIAHEAGRELGDGCKSTQGDVITRTRLAELKVYAPMIRIMSTTQVSSGTVQGNIPGPGSCPPGSYSASIPFNKDSKGAYFTAPTAAGSTCDLSVSLVDSAGNLTPLPNALFGASWSTGKPFGCASNGSAADSSDLNKRTFAVSQYGKPHAFVVYFKNQQTIGAKYQLKVEWH